jgi:uncharacterized protein YbaA (DUF1428 family)
MASDARKIWRKCGALEYVETVADDVQWGKTTSFPRSVKLKAGETVVLAYVRYKSRAHRDRVNARAMKEMQRKGACDPAKLPFDGMRMFWGGFKIIVK